MERKALKVVFFSYDAPGHISGVDSWLKNLLPQLQVLGVEINVVLVTRGAESRLEKLHYFKQQNVTTYTIPTEIYKYADARTERILTLLKQIQPDVMVPGYIMSAIYAGRWAKKAGIKVVGVLHSDDDFYHAITDEYIIKSSPFQFNAAVGVSAYLFDYLKRKSKHVWLAQIPYGVLVPDDAASFSRPLKLIYAGRLEQRQKRIMDVVKALCDATQKFDMVSADIYGEGSYREQVVEYINTNGNSRLSYKGVIEAAVISQTLKQCHALVLMSDYEGLPLALLEGMACGVVPICLQTESGIGDVVKHMETGIVLKNRDQDFLEAIQVLSKADIWQKLSNNARNLVKANYDIQVTAQEWLLLFKKLVENVVKTEILIPAKVELPVQHPGLIWENEYKPVPVIRLQNKINRILAGIKRRLSI